MNLAVFGDTIIDVIYMQNYYDIDYPWEIEIIENTGQLVNTVRSLEYQLECYVYKRRSASWFAVMIGGMI